VSRRRFGRDPRALLFQCWIDAGCNLLLRLLVPDADIGEAHLRRAAAIERLLCRGSDI
jgi:hypothetical protein